DLKSGLRYSYGDESLPAVSASASRDSDGKVHISLVNFHPETSSEISIQLRGMDPDRVSGRILTADALNAHNTFDQPDAVHPVAFEGMKLKNELLTFTLPAHSVVVLEVE
ncbi:MAG: alpha-L-arabinofuranosidase C-terminal domain-containing protein, partial [Bacteroidales bacterium]